MDVLNGENKREKYIFIESYPCGNDAIDEYLLGHKSELLERKIRNFGENNWYEWGALRNMKAIGRHTGKDCIYIYNMTRRDSVAFIDKVGYFGGGLIMMVPKVKCDLVKIVGYLNSVEFKNNFMFSGRFRIGHRQVCCSYLPDRVFEKN